MFLFVNGFLLFTLSVGIDRLLGLVGYPGEVPVAAPPHYKRLIHNEEFQYMLETNDRGLRNRTIPVTKPPGVWRIVVLGDSATEGTGVPVGERWTDLLEQSLGQTVEVVNCAESGQGPFNYGQKLFHICLDYDPDQVVIALHANDVADTMVGADPAQMFPGTKARRGTRLRQAAYTLWPHMYTMLRTAAMYGNDPTRGAFLRRVRAEVRRQRIDEGRYRQWLEMIPESRLLAAGQDRINPTILTYPLTRPEFYRESLDLATDQARAKFGAVCRILETIHERLAAREIGLAIVLLPSIYQYDPRSGDRLQARLFEAAGYPMRREWIESETTLELELAAWASRHSVPFLNLGPEFRRAVISASAPLHYDFDIHWTAEGNRVAAQAVGTWIADKHLVPISN